MGMPVTTYTVFRALANPQEAASYEISAAKKVLKPFNRFAFIIHDPQEHRAFHHKLTDQFDQLDFVTGEKLLFFALINAPSGWLRHARNRKYYKYINSLQARQLHNINKIKSSDPSLTAFALAHGLNIPQEALPVIVVANTLEVICRQQNQVSWFRTCPEHLELQLTKLGYLAARNQPLDPTDLDLCGGCGEESIGNLAKVLANALSAIVKTSDQWIQKQAGSDALHILATWQSELNRMKHEDPESLADGIENLSIKIAVHLAQIANKNAKQTDLLKEQFVSIKKEWLENPSYQILKTAQIISGLFNTTPTLLSNLTASEKSNYDYSPAIICLTKVFEREVNLSVVHWARNELGIELPQYFNKHQPSVNAKLLTGPSGEFVDFNMKSRKSWLPPGIGQSEIGCRQLSLLHNNRLPPNWEKQTWDELLNNWNLIRKERNKAAHTEIMDRTSFLKVQMALNELAERGVFEKLYWMKSNYRGSTSELL